MHFLNQHPISSMLMVADATYFIVVPPAANNGSVVFLTRKTRVQLATFASMLNPAGVLHQLRLLPRSGILMMLVHQ